MFLTRTTICGYKCYAEKQEIIDALKDNIREAIDEIQRPVFENRIISRRADVVPPPRSCNLTPDAVKDKCYADKPEAIDNMLKN